MLRDENKFVAQVSNLRADNSASASFGLAPV